MEIPKIYFDTNMLMDTIMKKAWESYRGGIAGCKISLENLRLEIDDLKREIEKFKVHRIFIYLFIINTINSFHAITVVNGIT